MKVVDIITMEAERELFWEAFVDGSVCIDLEILQLMNVLSVSLGDQNCALQFALMNIEKHEFDNPPCWNMQDS